MAVKLSLGERCGVPKLDYGSTRVMSTSGVLY